MPSKLEIELDIEIFEFLSDHNSTQTGVVRYYSTLFDQNFGSRLQVTFDVVIGCHKMVGYHYRCDYTNNEAGRSLKVLDSRISIIFGRYFNVTANNVNATLKFDQKQTNDSNDNDNNNNNNQARMMANDNSTDSDEMTSTTETTTVQVDTIILVEDEIINNLNNSYLVNIEQIFDDIINATRIIFNTSFVIIYSVDIDVSIIQVVDDNQDDSNSDSKNYGFWTPETVAVLMMIMIGLCISACIVVCMITFCCKKTQMSMFEKNQAMNPIYSVNSSEQSQSDVNHVQKDVSSKVVSNGY